VPFHVIDGGKRCAAVLHTRNKHHPPTRDGLAVFWPAETPKRGDGAACRGAAAAPSLTQRNRRPAARPARYASAVLMATRHPSLVASPAGRPRPARPRDTASDRRQRHPGPLQPGCRCLRSVPVPPTGWRRSARSPVLVRRCCGARSPDVLLNLLHQGQGQSSKQGSRLPDTDTSHIYPPGVSWPSGRNWDRTSDLPL
jgi:hypothetical protein